MKSIPCHAIGVPLVGLLLQLAGAAPSPPEEPRLASMSARGLARGAVRSIDLTGTALAGADGCLIQRLDARGEVVPGADPEVAARVETAAATTARLRLEARPGAALGPRQLRLMTPAGVSNPLLFQVGLYAEQAEAEPDNTPAQATRVAAPVVLEGVIHPAEDVDLFRLPARAGEALLCLLETFPVSNRPSENLDPTLLLKDATGRVLGVGRPRTGLDAMLTCAPTSSGDLLLEVRDAGYRGSPAFTYRITVGPAPLLTGIFPLGGAAGRTVSVTTAGVNLGAGATPLVLRLAADAPEELREVRVETPAGPSNARTFSVSRLLEATEEEPNAPPDPPNKVTPPIVVNGRADGPGDVDVFRFTGQAGQRLICDAVASRLGSPYDTYLVLETEAGAQVARNDDADGSDARLDVTLPTTTEYLLRVRNLQVDEHGPTCAYRLVIRPPQPDFGLGVRPDAVSVPQGGSTEVTVTLARRDGWDGPVTVVASPPPSLRGLTAEPVTIASGAREARLTLRATSGATAGHFLNVFLRATARVENQLVTREIPFIVTVVPDNLAHNR